METKLPVVLSVDDNDVDAALLQRAFKRTNTPAKLFTVSEGPQALTYLNAEGIYSDRVNYPFPDLVLLDLAMPKMSGLDVLQRIRQHPMLKKTTVLILTASERAEDRIQANEIGANGYLVKPSKFEDLKALVQKLNSEWLTPKPKKGAKTATARNAKSDISSASESSAEPLVASLAPMGALDSKATVATL